MLTSLAYSRFSAGFRRLAGLSIAVLFVATTASADPLYFNGPSFFGTTEALVNNNGDITVIDLDDPNEPLGAFDFSNAGTISIANPTCASDPGNPDCLDLGVVIPPSLPVNQAANPSFATPTTATSSWTVTNTSGFEARAILLFVTTPGAVSGNPLLVGLEPNPGEGYNIITFDAGGSFGQIYYAAIDLGVLAPGEAAQNVLVNYVVADLLIPDPNGGPMDFLLPMLNTQAILMPIPEPGVGMLLASGLVGLTLARRRGCV